MNYKIAIIILNYNSSKETQKLAQSLITNLHNNYDVFIIDNCSEDLEHLQQFTTMHDGLVINFDECQKYLNIESRLWLVRNNNNVGYAKGNNIGLRYAYNKGYTYAFIVNPDVEIRDFSVFEGLIEILKDKKKIGMVGPKIILSDGKEQYHIPNFRRDSLVVIQNLLYPIPSLVRRINEKYFGSSRVDWIIGCFFGLNLNVWKRVNFFDENTFLYFEEHIIAERLKRIGQHVCYAPKFEVFHNHLYKPDWFKNNQIWHSSKEYYEKTYFKNNKILNSLLVGSFKYQLIVQRIIKFIVKPF